MLDPAAIMKVLTDAREVERAKTRLATAQFLSNRADRHRHAMEVLDSVIAEMAREIGAEVER